LDGHDPLQYPASVKTMQVVKADFQRKTKIVAASGGKRVELFAFFCRTTKKLLRDALSPKSLSVAEDG
jgi:L-rhamnose isomerase